MFVIAVLWTAFFVINFNVAMMIPLLPFIERDIGLSPSSEAAILATFPIVALIGNLALGPLIDRYGRKRFIVAGAAGCAVLLLLTAAGRDATEIAAGRALTGAFMPMVGASVFAAIADYVPSSNRARAAGYITSAAPIAFLASISMGTLLGGLVTWQLPLIVLAGTCAALAASAAVLPSTDPQGLSSGSISIETYRDRLSSLALGTDTRLLMSSYFCWSAGMYLFLGLYPSWLVEHGLAAEGAGTIGVLLLLGEIGGLLGAVLSGQLAGLCRSPFVASAAASLGVAVVVLVVPFAVGLPAPQALLYGVFAFGRDLMLALILGGALTLVPAARRGSLNATLNAVYQTGAALGGLASAWFYGFQPDFTANAVASCLVFIAAAFLLRSAASATTELLARKRRAALEPFQIGD